LFTTHSTLLSLYTGDGNSLVKRIVQSTCISLAGQSAVQSLSYNYMSDTACCSLQLPEVISSITDCYRYTVDS